MNIRVGFLTTSGFPFGFAEIEKIKLICKSLINSNKKFNVEVLVRSSLHTREKEVKKSGIFEEIKYKYMNYSSYRSKYILVRKFNFVFGIIYELFYIFSLQFKQKHDFYIIYTKSFFMIILYYIIIHKFLNIPLFMLYMEYNTAKKHTRKKIFTRINDLLFDRYSFFFIDGVFPISEILKKVVELRFPRKNILKIPVLCDFSKFNICNYLVKENYFLFCGSIGYYEIIEFILESFELISDSTYYLYLILHGEKKAFQKILDRINENKKYKFIKIFSNLEYKTLVKYYTNAKALLIPLRPTLQDRARFPHKIGEYVATKRPIISTNYGEIKEYFTDMKNAIVAKHYNNVEYKQKMEFVINNLEKSNEIGIRGYQTGRNYFDYEIYGKKILNFYKTIKNYNNT